MYISTGTVGFIFLLLLPFFLHLDIFELLAVFISFSFLLLISKCSFYDSCLIKMFYYFFYCHNIILVSFSFLFFLLPVFLIKISFLVMPLYNNCLPWPKNFTIQNELVFNCVHDKKSIWSDFDMINKSSAKVSEENVNIVALMWT